MFSTIIIRRQIDYLQKQFQFNVHYNHAIDTSEKLGELENNYDAIFLGIGLGFRLLFDSSEESPDSRGLSLFKGEVKRFGDGLKVPHMGWNQMKIEEDPLNLFKGIPDKSYFYFVHSYF